MTQHESGKRLGRGLAALLGEVNSEDEAVQQARAQRRVPIERITSNPRNPRRDFDSQELDELAISIRENGVLQPLLVRPRPDRLDQYELIAGERRWQASQKAGLEDVPVIIYDVDDKKALEITIVENVQRTDLNPIEEATGYQQLIDEFQYTQLELSDIIGKSRSHVTNALRLLKLPEQVRQFLKEGQLSAGHAKVLVSVEAPLELALRIVEEGLSVRKAEELARFKQDAQNGSSVSKPSKVVNQLTEKDENVVLLEKELSEILGMVVDIRQKPNNQGELRIQFRTLEQLYFVAHKISEDSYA